MEKTTAKVFMTGRSQAVRIPKGLRFQVDEVEVVRKGEGLLLKPVQKDHWASQRSAIGEMEDFFPNGYRSMNEWRDQRAPMGEREWGSRE